jgi:predicted metal-binding membrane protein
VHSPALPRRDRIIIAASLVLVTLLAWTYLVHLDRQMASAMAEDVMMAEMGMAMDRSWTAIDVVFTFGMWAVMMVGMMAGSAAPVLMLFGAARRSRGSGHTWPGISLFALGYVLVWCGFSACAALAQWALHSETLLTSAMATSSSRLGGAILMAAGAYQLTPWKGACLTQCRSPLGFLMTHWREGDLGALRMGVGHGWYCLGCCWAVMCVLFVVGVMNLFWVAALTALVLLEKVGPAGAVVARVAGGVLIVAGLAIAAGLR